MRLPVEDDESWPYPSLGLVLPLRRHRKAPIRPAAFPGRRGCQGEDELIRTPIPQTMQALWRNAGQATRLSPRSC